MRIDPLASRKLSTLSTTISSLSAVIASTTLVEPSKILISNLSISRYWRKLLIIF